MGMCRYPDTLNNPNADPRVYQEQYERWWRECQERDKGCHRGDDRTTEEAPGE